MANMNRPPEATVIEAETYAHKAALRRLNKAAQKLTALDVEALTTIAEIWTATVIKDGAN